jgi:hypothetical protein
VTETNNGNGGSDSSNNPTTQPSSQQEAAQPSIKELISKKESELAGEATSLKQELDSLRQQQEQMRSFFSALTEKGVDLKGILDGSATVLKPTDVSKVIEEYVSKHHSLIPSPDVLSASSSKGRLSEEDYAELQALKQERAARIEAQLSSEVEQELASALDSEDSDFVLVNVFRDKVKSDYIEAKKKKAEYDLKGRLRELEDMLDKELETLSPYLEKKKNRKAAVSSSTDNNNSSGKVVNDKPTATTQTSSNPTTVAKTSSSSSSSGGTSPKEDMDDLVSLVRRSLGLDKGKDDVQGKVVSKPVRNAHRDYTVFQNTSTKNNSTSTEIKTKNKKQGK